jgi:hypothetical protein
MLNKSQKGKCKMTVKRKIMRIMDLVMEISPPDVKYNYEKKPVAFFTYSGHCPCLRVEVYENGWNREFGSRSKAFDVYNIHMKKYAEEVHQQLDEIIHYLEKLKRRR